MIKMLYYWLRRVGALAKNCRGKKWGIKSKKPPGFSRRLWGWPAWAWLLVVAYLIDPFLKKRVKCFFFVCLDALFDDFSCLSPRK